MGIPKCGGIICIGKGVKVLPDKLPFTYETIWKAWTASGGYCQCERTTHGHIEKHNKVLSFGRQGDTTGDYSWEAHHKDDPFDDSLSNCEIICRSCHDQIVAHDL
jgi:hypothetical protein